MISLDREKDFHLQAVEHAGHTDPKGRTFVPAFLILASFLQIRMGMMMYRYLYSLSAASSGRSWPADWASLNSKRTSPEVTTLRNSRRYCELKPMTMGSPS